MRYMSPEIIDELAKKTFGEGVVVTRYHDLKPAQEMDIEDSCVISYIGEKV